MARSLLVVPVLASLWVFSAWAENQAQIVSGKVVLEEGTPPPEPVAVDLICNASLLSQEMTSRKGQFTFQLGSRDSTYLDSSISRPPEAETFDAGANRFLPHTRAGRTGRNDFREVSGVNLKDCELRASLPGFSSDTVRLGLGTVAGHTEDVGVIVLRRRSQVKGTTVSLKTLAAPKKARKAYESAKKELSKDKIDYLKAIKDLEDAVASYPEFSAAWDLLGLSRLALKDVSGAREAFEHAVASESKYIAPYLSLAMLELRARRWQEALQWSKRALELNRHLSKAHYFHGLANFYSGQMKVAEESFREVQKSEGAAHHPLTSYLLGTILAQKGSFRSAAAEFRYYLQAQPGSPIAANVRKQLAEWEEQSLIDPPS